MRLSRLTIRRLPGIAPEFSLDFRDGVNLVTGPNGSGKSSLTRAVFQLLWPDLRDTAAGDLEARFEDDGRWWQAATHDGRTVRWVHQGEAAGRPDLPDAAVAASYRLSLFDLTPPGMGEDDRALAQRIRRQMDGGFDLTDARDKLFPPAPKAGQTEARRWTEARNLVQAIMFRYRDLAQREKGLEQLRADRAQAALAHRRITLLKALAAQVRLGDELVDLGLQLEALPPGAAQVAEGDPALLKERRDQQRESLRLREEAERELERLRRERDAAALPAAGRAAFSLDLLDQLLESLGKTDDLLAQTRVQLAGLAPPAEEKPPTSPVDRRTFLELIGLHADLQAVEAGLARARTERQELERSSAGRLWPAAAWLAGGIGAAGWGGLRVAGHGIDPAGLAVLGLGIAALGWGTFLLGRRRHRDLADVRRRLDRELAELETRRRPIADGLQELARRHGLDLDNRDLLHDLKEASARLDVQQENRRRREELAGRRDQLERDRAAALEQVNGQLALAGCAEAANREEARATRQELDRRLRRLEALGSRIGAAEAALAQADRDLARVEQDINGIFGRLQLDPDTDGDAAVDHLARVRPERENLLKRMRDAESAARAQAAIVAADPGLVDEAALGRLPAARIDEMIAREEDLAGQADALTREIADLESALDTARAADQLAQARAQADQQRDDLLGKRDEARRAALGAALLDLVRRQSESRSRPRVLAQARDLFAQFTAGHHELEVGAAGDAGAFLARDTRTGLHLGLDQLSDGTRAQLLLAVRLGFIFQTESGFQPPLFLDDSLGSSDPARFAAVATGLGLLARDHRRQIIFLTPDPADVAAWQQALAAQDLPAAHVIDLAEVRKLAAQAPAQQLRAPATAAVPAPSGLDAVDYALALGVPGLDPWAEAEAAHLFYLLSDRLELLHALVVAGCPALGPWANRRAPLVEAGVLSPGQDALLEARAEVWRAVQAAWRVGRSRPLDLAEVENSGVVTAANRERLAEVLARCGGEAGRFMDAVRAGGVPRFRNDKKNQLQEHLELEGYLDGREVHDDDGLVRQVLSEVAPLVGAGRLSADEVRRQTLTLAAYLDTSGRTSG